MFEREAESAADDSPPFFLEKKVYLPKLKQKKYRKITLDNNTVKEKFFRQKIKEKN